MRSFAAKQPKKTEKAMSTNLSELGSLLRTEDARRRLSFSAFLAAHAGPLHLPELGSRHLSHVVRHKKEHERVSDNEIGIQGISKHSGIPVRQQRHSTLTHSSPADLSAVPERRRNTGPGTQSWELIWGCSRDTSDGG